MVNEVLYCLDHSRRGDQDVKKSSLSPFSKDRPGRIACCLNNLPPVPRLVLGAGKPDVTLFIPLAINPLLHQCSFRDQACQAFLRARKGRGGHLEFGFPVGLTQTHADILRKGAGINDGGSSWRRVACTQPSGNPNHEEHAAEKVQNEDRIIYLSNLLIHRHFWLIFPRARRREGNWCVKKSDLFPLLTIYPKTTSPHSACPCMRGNSGRTRTPHIFRSGVASVRRRWDMTAS
jgi:hypothetical protein